MAAVDVRTGVQIGAPPDRVWAVVADLAAYPSWNPLVKAVADWRPAVGAPFVLTIRPLGRGVATSVRAPVVAAEPGVALAWAGELAGPLLTFRHTFRLVPLEGGRTYLNHHERFEGALAATMFAAAPLLRRSYRRWDDALRARVEAGGA